MLNAVIEIVRMQPGGPAVAQFLLQSAAREGEPAFVDERAAFVGAGYPDHQRRGVGHVPESFIAFASRRVGPQSVEFSDIGAQAGKAGRAAGRVAQRRAAPLNPPAAAILRQDAALEERLRSAGRLRRPGAPRSTGVETPRREALWPGVRSPLRQTIP